MNRKAHTRLSLEALEDRTAPSTLIGSAFLNPQPLPPGIVSAASAQPSLEPPDPCIVSLHALNPQPLPPG